MSVLVFLDQAEGQIKKNSFEAACYGAKIAELMNTQAKGVVLGSVNTDLAGLGKYGLGQILSADQPELAQFDSVRYCEAIAELAEKEGAQVIVLSNNFNGKAVAPRLSVRLKAGLVTGAVDLPDLKEGFVVKRGVFSGKAFASVSIKTDIKIITLNTNSYPVTDQGPAAQVEKVTVQSGTPSIKIKEVKKVVGEVPLSEANIVVSGGRGLKGPENWNIVTDLAHALGAATACSRPVSDSDWRPHHEHVGQTGLTIAPNLYIAIGISGAIQHLAGVNRSKTIVVINKDPEAPFFKAADYGIVGDAFEVVPKMTEAILKLKQAG